MKTDLEVQHNVLAELEREPAIDAAEVGVSVLNGVVTLTGTTASFAEEWAAEQATLCVAGVTAVVNEIDVRPIPSGKRSDAQIARSALRALESNIYVPENRIKVKVQQGWVTLEGTVEWHHQREAAENAVHHMIGVRGVKNLIGVKPSVKSPEGREKIKKALHRTAQML